VGQLLPARPRGRRPGEEVTYQYDTLNRLISAQTTGPDWGQSFGYDGFGNLLSQTVTKGSAPSLSVTVNPATNRITNSGTSYDAKGNLTAMPGLTMTYDVKTQRNLVVTRAR
jgi:YD repeat-containing protein